MRAIQVSKTGGPEVLELVDIPVPQPKANEALVKIEASGVNFIDVYFREGRYPTQLPFISGREMAGVVTDVGKDVKEFRPGDRVAQTGVMGSYAEYQSVPQDQLVHVPAGVTNQQAAASMLQGATMHYLMRSTYPLRAGEVALVHAAAGGMGLLLTQLGKIIGATIIGTVSTDEKAKLARDAGADHIINYTNQDFVAEVKRITGNQGVDVVYDGVGKTTFDGSLSVLRPRGYMVLFGGASGAVPPFDPIRLTQLGSLFLTRPSLSHYIAKREELVWRMTEVFNLIAAGDLKIHIGATYSLRDSQQAHRDLEARKTTGKVLILPS
ncbi:MAG TPA: quinone oxidoreductase [Terriglobales bacterium]|nr:quinone oxidoreductase [Terriglobales bacterium]